jgi:hypothetical protein
MNNTNQNSPLALFSPDGLIQAARSAHPAFKFAIVAAGMASLVSVVLKYGASPASVVFGVIILGVFMTFFLVFAQAAVLSRTKLSHAALVLVWCYLGITLLTSILLFTSAFFNGPLPFRSFIVKQLSPIDATQMFSDATFTGEVRTKEGGVDRAHRVSLILSVSGQVVGGKYTNSAGDAGIVSGTLSGNSLELQLVSSKVPGTCRLAGRLDSVGTRLTAIYNCSDGEYAQVDLTRADANP